jgi:hypothetical protein
VFYAAFFQMVKDLIAGDPARAGDRLCLVEIVGVEIADAPRKDLTVLPQFLEGGDGFFERVTPAPVEEVAVEAVRPEAGK